MNIFQKIDIHVGKRLRLRRNMVGLNQEQLGNFLGVSFQQIQKYERGLNRIGASRLYQLALLLNTQVAFFFEEIESEDTSESLSYVAETKVPFEYEKIIDKEMNELIRAFSSIKDPHIRKNILQLTKNFVHDVPSVKEEKE